MNSHLSNIIYNILQTINNFPNMPKEIIDNGGIEIGASNSRKTSLSFKPISTKFERTICANWTFYYKFDLIYQCACINNEDRLNAIDFLSSLTHWLVGNYKINDISVHDFLPVQFSNGSLDRFIIENDVTILSRDLNGIELFSSTLNSLSTILFCEG